jgi:hypothetical protein
VSMNRSIGTRDNGEMIVKEKVNWVPASTTGLFGSVGNKVIS